ncbi:MAG TPA: response regulator [Thermoplasmata archaeon]|nr:response regulator [Thermoplasmata archaeon]
MVDDDDELRESLAAYLRTALHQTSVETATDGKKALERIERSPVDVLLVDYQMPGMDGIELLERVRQIAPDCVRLMLTGRADFEVAQRAVNEGHVFGFLTKGADPDEILGRVTAAVDAARMLLARRRAAEGTAQQNRRLRAGAFGR